MINATEAKGTVVIGVQNTEQPILAEGISQGFYESPVSKAMVLTFQVTEERVAFPETADFTGGFQGVVHRPASPPPPVTL